MIVLREMRAEELSDYRNLFIPNMHKIYRPTVAIAVNRPSLMPAIALIAIYQRVLIALTIICIASKIKAISAKIVNWWAIYGLV